MPCDPDPALPPCRRRIPGRARRGRPWAPDRSTRPRPRPVRDGSMGRRSGYAHPGHAPRAAPPRRGRRAMEDEPPVLIAGRYRLMDRIGSGGMGHVWLAWDERLNRAVARQAAALPRRPARRRGPRRPRSRHARGAHHRAPAPSERRPRLRRRRPRGPAVPGHAVPPVAQPSGRPGGARAPAGARGGPDRQRARVRPRRRPPGGHRAPRRQAGQRADHRRRLGTHHRLRHLARPRRRHAHLDRHGVRHAGLPRARGGSRRVVQPARTSSRSAPPCSPRWREPRPSAPATTRWRSCTASRRGRSIRRRRAP